jgi:hypothetical protein
MARTARPWYFIAKHAYAATVKGRRVILLKGDKSDANEKLAAAELKKILKGTRNDTQLSLPSTVKNRPEPSTTA